MLGMTRQTLFLLISGPGAQNARKIGVGGGGRRQKTYLIRSVRRSLVTASCIKGSNRGAKRVNRSQIWAFILPWKSLEVLSICQSDTSTICSLAHFPSIFFGRKKSDQIAKWLQIRITDWPVTTIDNVILDLISTFYRCFTVSRTLFSVRSDFFGPPGPAG